MVEHIMILSFNFSYVTIYLWYHGAEYELARAIGLFAKEEVEKRQFVDMKVEIDVSVGSHCFVRLLGDTGDLFLSQGSNIQESSVE